MMAGMQQMLQEHGIEVPEEALADPTRMLPFWQDFESQLPDGVSIHEEWAAQFYGA